MIHNIRISKQLAAILGLSSTLILHDELPRLLQEYKARNSLNELTKLLDVPPNIKLTAFNFDACLYRHISSVETKWRVLAETDPGFAAPIEANIRKQIFLQTFSPTSQQNTFQKKYQTLRNILSKLDEKSQTEIFSLLHMECTTNAAFFAKMAENLVYRMVMLLAKHETASFSKNNKHSNSVVFHLLMPSDGSTLQHTSNDQTAEFCSIVSQMSAFIPRFSLEDEPLFTFKSCAQRKSVTVHVHPKYCGGVKVSRPLYIEMQDLVYNDPPYKSGRIEISSDSVPMKSTIFLISPTLESFVSFLLTNAIKLDRLFKPSFGSLIQDSHGRSFVSLYAFLLNSK